MLQRVLIFFPIVLLLACQPQPGVPPGTAPQSWDHHLAPIVPYEIVVLNPEETRDYEFIERALRRKNPEKLRAEYRWLPTTPQDGRRGYAELAGRADDMRVRQQLRSCLRESRAPSDTSDVQVLIVRLYVSRDGAILEAGVRASTVENSDVLVCLLQTVVGWRFVAGKPEERFDMPLVLIPTSLSAQAPPPSPQRAR